MGGTLRTMGVRLGFRLRLHRDTYHATFTVIVNEALEVGSFTPEGASSLTCPTCTPPTNCNPRTKSSVLPLHKVVGGRRAQREPEVRGDPLPIAGASGFRTAQPRKLCVSSRWMASAAVCAGGAGDGPASGGVATRARARWLAHMLG